MFRTAHPLKNPIGKKLFNESKTIYSYYNKLHKTSPIPCCEFELKKSTLTLMCQEFQSVTDEKC